MFFTTFCTVQVVLLILLHQSIAFVFSPTFLFWHWSLLSDQFFSYWLLFSDHFSTSHFTSLVVFCTGRFFSVFLSSPISFFFLPLPEKHRVGLQATSFQPAARRDGRIREASRSSRRRYGKKCKGIGGEHASYRRLLRPRPQQVSEPKDTATFIYENRGVIVASCIYLSWCIYTLKECPGSSTRWCQQGNRRRLHCY